MTPPLYRDDEMKPETKASSLARPTRPGMPLPTPPGEETPPVKRALPVKPIEGAPPVISKQLPASPGGLLKMPTPPTVLPPLRAPVQQIPIQRAPALEQDSNPQQALVIPTYKPTTLQSERNETPSNASSKKAFEPTSATSKRIKTKSGSLVTVKVGRIIAFILLLVMTGAGIKSILIPPNIPSKGVIVSGVQSAIGVTNFPGNEGSAFVMSFVNAYLTVDADSPGSRTLALSLFASNDVLASGGISYPTGFSQKVVDGPYIYSAKYRDDFNATYVVGALTDSSEWTYLAVSVYYDKEARAFAISSAPTLVPPPTVIKAPNAAVKGIVNEDETTASKSTITSFFQAWGASDSGALSVVLSPEADARARSGLGGDVKFESLTYYSVYKPTEGADPTIKTRVATATVKWTETTNDGTVTYTSNYQLLIQSANGGKWYIKDILPDYYSPAK